MKKLLTILLVICLLLSFVACTDKDSGGADESSSQPTISESELTEESNSDESESQTVAEEDDWFGEEESESQSDRWTNNQ